MILRLGLPSAYPSIARRRERKRRGRKEKGRKEEDEYEKLFGHEESGGEYVQRVNPPCLQALALKEKIGRH